MHTQLAQCAAITTAKVHVLLLKHLPTWEQIADVERPECISELAQIDNEFEENQRRLEGDPAVSKLTKEKKASLQEKFVRGRQAAKNNIMQKCINDYTKNAPIQIEEHLTCQADSLTMDNFNACTRW